MRQLAVTRPHLALRAPMEELEEDGKDLFSGFDLSDGQYEDFHDQSITIAIQETVGNVCRGSPLGMR